MKKLPIRRILTVLPIIIALLLAAFTAMADVTLPSRLTVIPAEAFRGDARLTGTLTIPAGVTIIGERAFEGCTGLTGTLVIPQGVTTIGSRAFANCTGLSGTVRIPASVTSLADDAFDGTSLIIITGGSTDLPDDDDEEIIITMTDLPAGFAYEMTREGAVITGYTGKPEARLSIPGAINGIPVVAIGDYAFQDCYGLTGSVVIPGSVKRIGTGAFYGCASLDGTLSIPSSVVSIGDFAFYECLSLTGGLTIPASVESIGTSAFAFCESMNGSLSLPANVTLGERCFQGAGFTGSITIPATMTLGPNVFTGTALNIIWASSGFTYEQHAGGVTITGWNGPVTEGLTIPATLGGASVTAIASEAFSDIGLTGTVTIPGSVRSIGESAFHSNAGITALHFSSGLESIGAYAFAGCTGLSGTITLPATVTQLDPDAFAGCSATVVIAQ